MLYRFLFLALTVFVTQPLQALDSDTEQPAMLDADDFEIDLSTGVRIYRGNVVFRQGSIRIECDELVTHLNEDGALDKGVCTGSPGRFKQTPEGSSDDVIGVARKITMDQIEEVVVLKTQAKVSQGGTQISGRLITYDLVTEKVKVKGGGNQTAGAKKSDGGDTAEGESDSAESGSSRPSLVIQPRKKKKN